MKSGGLSGLDVLLAGYRSSAGAFSSLDSFDRLWTSSESGTSAWYRYFDIANTQVLRLTHTKVVGYSVRCLVD